MSIYIETARQRRGHVWAEKYPEKADDLYVVAHGGGKRKRVYIGPPTPENQRAAAKKVAEWEYLHERKTLVAAGIVSRTFSEAAEVWLRRGLSHRAPNTLRVRRGQVNGLNEHFQLTPLDRIGAVEIAQWWDKAIEGRLDSRTGRGYLTALSMIFRYTAKSQPGLANPVPAARDLIFSEIERTAEFRAKDELNCNPLTSRELERLLPKVEATGNRDLLLTVLFCYEAGLRLGEALGLQWADVWWGRDEMDTTRHVHVRRSRGDGVVGHTKSGLSRKVGMSRRLRRHLQARYLEAGRPEDDTWLIGQSRTNGIRERLKRCCTAAKVRSVRPKDLRDTYASTLVTNGIVLKWISLQLGHASLAVTERHYASYMAMDGYRNPWMVPEGGMPSDLFETLDRWAGAAAPTQPHTAPTSQNGKVKQSVAGKD